MIVRSLRALAHRCLASYSLTPLWTGCSTAHSSATWCPGPQSISLSPSLLSDQRNSVLQSGMCMDTRRVWVMFMLWDVSVQGIVPISTSSWYMTVHSEGNSPISSSGIKCCLIQDCNLLSVGYLLGIRSLSQWKQRIIILKATLNSKLKKKNHRSRKILQKMKIFCILSHLMILLSRFSNRTPSIFVLP